MKRQVDRRWQEVKEWKKEEKIMLSTKDLVFKKRPAKKLMERYVRLYEIEEVVEVEIASLYENSPSG